MTICRTGNGMQAAYIAHRPTKRSVLVWWPRHSQWQAGFQAAATQLTQTHSYVVQNVQEFCFIFRHEFWIIILNQFQKEKQHQIYDLLHVYLSISTSYEIHGVSERSSCVFLFSTETKGCCLLIPGLECQHWYLQSCCLLIGCNKCISNVYKSYIMGVSTKIHGWFLLSLQMISLKILGCSVLRALWGSKCFKTSPADQHDSPQNPRADPRQVNPLKHPGCW